MPPNASVASMASRLSPMSVLLPPSIPRFTTSAKAKELAWSDLDVPGLEDLDTTPFKATSSSWNNEMLSKDLDPSLSAHSSLPDFLEERLKSNNIRCVIFGEQHHQPRVLAAQLQLIYSLATRSKRKVTLLMEHFNLTQQVLLRSYARDGDAEALVREYVKSSDGFRLTMRGYLPLLLLARELPKVHSEILAGFPPREWARTIMREGKEGLLLGKSQAPAPLGRYLENFDRWDQLQVSLEHSAYIRASIGGGRPELRDKAHVEQGGLSAAQAFKDSVMAWKIDTWLEGAPDNASSTERPDDEERELMVVICGSGHCEYGFGVTERIRGCPREQILLIVTKPNDGTYWSETDDEGSASEEDHEGMAKTPGRLLADGVIIYEPVDV